MESRTQVEETETLEPGELTPDELDRIAGGGLIQYSDIWLIAFAASLVDPSKAK
jgi:hypothetical protein